MRNLPLLLPAGDCGDGVVPVPGGWQLHGNPGPDAVAEADNRPTMPGLTQFYPEQGMLGSSALSQFLERQPALALDRTVVTLPAAAGGLNLFTLGQWADQLGLPVQARVADLRTEPWQTLPYAQHRVVDLHPDGQMAVPGTGATVRVVPQASRAPRPYADVPAEAVSMVAARPYPPGRVVFTDGGIELGLPAGLVNNDAAIGGHPLTDVIRDMDGVFQPEAFEVVGATSVQTLDGYVDLLHQMQSAEPGTHGLVVVDHPTGAGSEVYLGVREPNGVWFLDLARLKPALFTKDPTAVRFAVLPGGSLPVTDRLSALDAAWLPRVDASLPLYLPPGATGLGTPESGHAVVVIGPHRDEPASVLEAARRVAQEVDQPVIVLAVRRAGSAPEPDRVAALRTLLEVYGWRGRVPVVITRAQVGPLEEVLDEYRASVVYQTPGSNAAARPGGALGGLAALNLSNLWTVRPAGGTVRQAASGDRPAERRVSEVLSTPLVQAAAGRRRRPAFNPPSVPVASFLSVSLTNPAGIRTAYRDRQEHLRAKLPQVQQIIRRDPAFSGHHAVLSLAELGQFDSAMAYLEAGDDTRADEIVKPLLSVARPDSEAGGQTIHTMLPHLAALAGGQVNDRASQAILHAIGDLIAGHETAAQVKADVWTHKDHLPQGGVVRVAWIRSLNTLIRQMPQHGESLNSIAEAIVTCP